MVDSAGPGGRDAYPSPKSHFLLSYFCFNFPIGGSSGGVYRVCMCGIASNCVYDCDLFFRVKPAIFDLLLALCIAAYLGIAYIAVQVSTLKHVSLAFWMCTLQKKCRQVWAE